VFRLTLRPILVVAAALAAAPALAAQSTATPQQPPCSSAEHRHFDFWIGEWDVAMPDGKPAGKNRITAILNGCVLLEEWTGAGGGSGKSFNLFVARQGQWHQTWVDGNGGILELDGGLNGSGEMVLSGDQALREGGTALNRITWTPRSANEVRQHWEVSTDGGATWRTAFDGMYRRVK
jgi:hypothetical protein